MAYYTSKDRDRASTILILLNQTKESQSLTDMEISTKVGITPKLTRKALDYLVNNNHINKKKDLNRWVNVYLVN